MSKRHLTQQQRRRIDRHQGDRIRRQTVDEALASQGDEQIGLVMVHRGALLEVESRDADGHPLRVQCHQRANIEPIAVGDRVVWRRTGIAGEGVITALLPRSALLARPSSHGGLRPIAANLDLVVIVLAPQPAPIEILLDRYLVAVEQIGIDAMLVLNKCDLLTSLPAADADSVRALLELYRGLGYPTLETSCHDHSGMAALTERLQRRTAILVGQSGVGKSSLLKALLPEAEIALGAISAANLRGRHTTTTAQLYHLPQGGDLIDSPGVREFGLWHLSPDAVWAGFRELRPLLGRCRFRDCQHQQEPDCAMTTAIAAGVMAPSRWQNLRRILANDGSDSGQ
ncbi:MAG TPA: small ribosomal subunit biogenesis GTPase RsgA [Pseudomonadales bacterium]|nr:small ribosomal subunit biogenesis GTPase RsgA [Pseudomonadales bacterium]